MRFLIKTIILICCPLVSLGQVDKESLFAIWNDTSADDSLRINAIHDIYSKNYFKQPDSIFSYAEKAYDFAKQKNLKKEMAFALFTKGITSNNLGKFKKAEEFLLESLAINEEIFDSLGIAKSKSGLGNIYLKQSDYIKAISSYRQSLNLLKGLKKKKEIGVVQNNIGLVFYDLKDYEKALKYLNNALTTYNEIGDEIGEGNTIINIGSIYRQQKDYNKALEFYNKGLNLKKKNNQSQGFGICYSNIGLVYQALGDKQKAMNYFSQSLDLHKANGNQKEIANCLLYLAELKKDNNINTSIKLAEEALGIAKETGSFAEVAKASEVLYKEYEAKGEFKKALAMYKLSQSTKENIYGVKVQKAVLKNEMQFEEKTKNLEQKIDTETTLNNNNSKTQKWRLATIGIVGIIAAISTWFLFSFKKKSQQNSEVQKELNDKIEALKQKLTTQSTIFVEKRKELSLDKEKIEKTINSKLGESSWDILNVLFEDPAVSNKEIAAKVSLSLEGVSSSLRRMYTAFDIKSSNKKIALIMKAIKISIEE